MTCIFSIDKVPMTTPLDIFARLDSALNEPITLCLIDGAATLLMGMPSRPTEGLDAWEPASHFREDELRRAAEAAGLIWDPKDDMPAAPYLRIVCPGIVQVPGWNAKRQEWFGQPEEVAWRGETLTITVPPPECLFASKLVRGDRRSIEDCLWLRAMRRVDAKTIIAAVRRLPGQAREQAQQTMEMLNILRLVQ